MTHGPKCHGCRKLGGVLDPLPTPVLLLVYALAVARVTGLVTQDDLTEEARHRFVTWLDDRPRTLGSYLAKLVTCPWCAGMWISLAAAPLVWRFAEHPVLFVPALAMAFSQVAGMTSQMGR